MTRSLEPDAEYEIYERHMALVDEILGLRAALAQEAVRNSPSRKRLEDMEDEVAAIRRSATWRIGKLVIAPLRTARNLFRRSRR